MKNGASLPSVEMRHSPTPQYILLLGMTKSEFVFIRSFFHKTSHLF